VLFKIDLQSSYKIYVDQNLLVSLMFLSKGHDDSR